jgi:two-component system OmpR family sensor kinase
MERPAWAKSVRFQLTFWYVTTLAAILLLAAVTLFWSLRRAMLRQTDQMLATSAAQVVHLLTTPLEPSDPKESQDRPSPSDVLADASPGAALLRGVPTVSISMRLFRADTRETVAASRNLDAQGTLARTLSAVQIPSRPGPAFVFAGPDEEDRIRCLTLPVPQTPYLLQAATSWDDVEDLLERLMLGIGGTILLFLFLSGVGSWLLVGRAFRPIESIVTEAEHLTIERPAPMSLQPRSVSDNEIGHLVAALNRMLARLSGAFTAQRQFTADASHELRTPLTILQGELELALARERTASEYRGTLESGLEETRRMTRIVDSLAYLARGDGDGTRSAAQQWTLISLTALARDTIQMLRRAADEKQQSLTADCLDGVFVLGSEEALNRVVRNLLDNAIRYTPPGGRITVVAEERETECRLSVNDTGIGIAPEDLPFVFNRFFRADKARVNDGGTGLGLSICQSIVAAHGGRLEVESVPTVGSRFSIILPKMSDA